MCSCVRACVCVTFIHQCLEVRQDASLFNPMSALNHYVSMLIVRLVHFLSLLEVLMILIILGTHIDTGYSRPVLSGGFGQSFLLCDSIKCCKIYFLVQPGG